MVDIDWHWLTLIWCGRKFLRLPGLSCLNYVVLEEKYDTSGLKSIWNLTWLSKREEFRKTEFCQKTGQVLINTGCPRVTAGFHFEISLG